MKRKFFRAPILGALLCAVMVLTGCDGLLDGLLDRKIKQEITRPKDNLLEDAGIHVIMVGTGSPRIDPKRAPACVAVIAGGEFLLFDAGEACVRQMATLDLPIDRIGTVFITHLHSDHIGGLGQVLNCSWIWDRRNTVDIYGPDGIDDVVNGINMTYTPDIDFRMKVQGKDILDPDHAIGSSKLISIEGPDAVTVFERNGVSVRAFLVEHQPIEPAFGFRIEYKGRSVVISGDTRKSEQVIRHARGADLLIHEAMNKHMVSRVAGVFEQLGRPKNARHMRNVMAYHTDTIEAAQGAQEAGVDSLVLTHIIPPLPNAISKWMFRRGMSDHFDGEIIIAEDGMRFYLEPGE